MLAGPGRARVGVAMADIDFAELAKDPIYVGLVLGLLGIVVYFALGRKSFGPVPSRCPWLRPFTKNALHQ